MKNRRFTVLLSLPLLFLLLLASCTTTPTALRERETVAFGQVFTVNGRATPLLTVPFTDVSVYLLSDKSTTLPLVSKTAFNKDQTVTVRVSVVGTKGIQPKEFLDSVKDLASQLVKNGVVSKDVAEPVSTAILVAVKGATALVGNVLILVQD